MSKILMIKANNRPAKQSVSVKMINTFLEELDINRHDINVVDLFEEEMPYLDTNLITALSKKSLEIKLTDKEKYVLNIADKHIKDFINTEIIVLGFPLWNMTVPAVLHTYFDYLYRAGVTFKYTSTGSIGLAADKMAIILNARGGVYSEPPESYREMAVNFVQNSLHFFGIENIKKVIIEGHNQYPESTEEIIKKGIEEIKLLAKSINKI